MAGALISDLVQIIKRDHFPNDPASSTDIDNFQSRFGKSLPGELRQLYLAFDGAKLFHKVDPLFRILPLHSVKPMSELLHSSAEGIESLVGFCKLGDSDYLAIDLGIKDLPVFDCFHETFPSVSIIGASFTEVLHDMLNSNGTMSWLPDPAEGAVEPKMERSRDELDPWALPEEE